MSAVDLSYELASDPLPSPSGLVVVDAGSDHDGSRLVLSFPIQSRAPQNLTRAEREVIEGILAGLPTRAIAERRGVSPRTVANQIARIFSKLRVGSRLSLVLSVHGSGWVPANGCAPV